MSSVPLEWASFAEALRAYIETFDEGPPVFGMDEAEAIRHIRDAILSGEPMTQGAESKLPPGALL